MGPGKATKPFISQGWGHSYPQGGEHHPRSPRGPALQKSSAEPHPEDAEASPEGTDPPPAPGVGS